MTEPPDDAANSPFAGLSKKIRVGKSAAAYEYENRPPMLSVTRRRDGAELRVGGIRTLIRGLANSFRATVEAEAFTIELDGQTAGTLASGATLQMEVTAEAHTLRIVTPIAKSSEVVFQIKNGQRFKYSCFCTMTDINLMRDD